MRSRSRSTCWRAWGRVCETSDPRKLAAPAAGATGSRSTPQPGRVESFIEFAPGRTLVYLLKGSFHVTAVTANFDGQAIRVMVPVQVLTEWIESDQVSISGQSQAGLQLLIEKDFGACISLANKMPTPTRIRSCLSRP